MIEKIDSANTNKNSSENLPGNAFEKILEWSEGLPDWQSDALRRILQQHELTEQDISEILDMLKAEHGLIDYEKLTIRPKRLTKKDIPTQFKSEKKVILKAMHDLENVNAIVPKQSLNFSPTGMTIIYGHNASGKSGYARVLKKACRARGQKEPILPNVFSDTLSTESARAVIDINEGKNDISIQWKDDEDTPDELASITVFDSKCARVYVDEANDVAYVPYGLDSFDKLSKLCEKLKNILQNEIEKIVCDREIFTDLQGNTSVGKLIDRLNSNTPITEVEDLSNLSEEEKKKLSEIEKKLTEIKVNEPKRKAESLRIKKRRLDRLLDSIKQLETALSSEAIEKIKKSQTELDVAFEAAQIASRYSFRSEPLPGVISEPWKIMFEAAKQYSEKYAYPGEPFPVTKENARCVLCFQVLSTEAVDRLKRFKEFIEEKTERIYQSKKHDYEIEVLKVNNLQLDPFVNDPDLIKEIEELSTETATSITQYLSNISTVQEAVKDSITTRRWKRILAKKDAPIGSLNNIINELEKRAKEFEGMAIPDEMAKLEMEFYELNARKKLSNKKKLVINFIDNLKRIEKLTSCIRATTTTGISRKSAELMELLITEKLKQNLKKEFEFLNVGYIKIDLDKTGRSGVTFHQFRLQSKTHATANLSDVLCEGEQGAIAIASFLAELQTSSNDCGIIFDDPVSSLDHMRRDLVAKRLALEAKKRQVIIFTHDLVFLVALQQAAENQGIDCFIQTVWGNPSGTGYCDPNVPWAGQKVSKRIGYLKGHALEKAKKLYNIPEERENYERRVDDFFNKLRETWERAIEEVVFNDTIQRFRDSVETNRLKRVKFADEDYRIIISAMSKCSQYLHDRAAARNEVIIPDPKSLEKEIECLETFVDTTRKQRDKIEKNR